MRINARKLGAAGDGIADDTMAIQAAFDRLSNYTCVAIPAGRYRIRSPLRVPGNLIYAGIVGDPMGSVLEFEQTAADWITLGQHCVHFAVSDLALQARVVGRTTAGAAISMTNAEGEGWMAPVFQNLVIVGAYIGFDIGKPKWKSEITDLHHQPQFYNCILRNITNFGFRIRQCFDPTLSNCFVGGNDYNRAICYQFEEWTQGGYFSNCLAEGGYIGWQFGGGGSTASINAMTMVNCVSDQSGYHGIGIVGIERLIISNCFVATQQRDARGIDVGASAREVLISDCFVENIATHGIVIEKGALRTKIHDSVVTSCSLDRPNTYDGIFVAPGVQEFYVQNCRVFNNASYYNGQQRYALTIGPGANYYIIEGNDFHGNQTGGLNDLADGANKIVANNL